MADSYQAWKKTRPAMWQLYISSDEEHALFIYLSPRGEAREALDIIGVSGRIHGRHGI